MKLTKGTKYNPSLFVCTGWTVGDGSGYDGYNVSSYFDADSAFLGPDEHGIEPLFADVATLYDYKTGERIRPATAEELQASRAAGPEGVIAVEIKGQVVSCYVTE